MPDSTVDWDPATAPDPGFRDATRELLAANPGAPPFANPTLIAGLQQIFRPSEALRIATLRDGNNTPQAQLALVLRRTHNGPVPVRQLEGGPRNQASLTELLTASDLDAAVVLLSGIRAQHDWDLLELRAVPADGQLARAALQVGATVRPDVPAYGIPLDSTIPILSSGRNRELGRLRRRMGESTGCTVEMRSPGDSDWPDVVAALPSLHTSRWHDTASPSPFADAALTERFAEWFSTPPQGVSPIAAVVANNTTGVISGVVLGLIGGNATHAWRMAYDPALKPFSPGIQLLTAMAEAARDAGHVLMELGRGAEPYKQSWNCIRHERATVRWHRATAATRVIRLLGALSRRSGLGGWGG